MSITMPTKIFFCTTSSWFDLRANSVSPRQDVALAHYAIAAGSSPYAIDNMGAGNRRWTIRGTFEVSGVDQTYTEENGYITPTLLLDMTRNTGSKLFYDAGWAIGSPVVEIKSWGGDRDDSTAKAGYEVGYRLKYNLTVEETT